jgi:hypothetical protein
MAIEIVTFPMKHGDFPVRYVNVHQRVRHSIYYKLDRVYGITWVPLKLPCRYL